MRRLERRVGYEPTREIGRGLSPRRGTSRRPTAAVLEIAREGHRESGQHGDGREGVGIPDH
jgi:hypothetical protein